MFKTFQGVTEDAKNTVYLRPETAQGIFVNFKNVQRTSRKKIPFGIGQIAQSVADIMTFFICIPFTISFFKKLPQDETDAENSIGENEE